MSTGTFLERNWFDCINLELGGKIILPSLVFLCSFYYLSFFRKKRNLPPGPIGLPILGYWPFIAKNYHIKLNDLAKNYGNVFGLYLGRTYVVVCNDWPSIKEAYSKPETLSRPTSTFGQIPSGIGFPGYNGQEWFEQRRFSVKAMKDIGLGRPQWENLVQEEVEETVARIQSHSGQDVDIHHVFASTFTNNILAMLFGHRLPYGDPEVARLSHNMDVVMAESASLGLNNFLPTLGGMLRTIGMYGGKNTAGRINEYCTYLRKCVDKWLQNQEMVDQESFVKAYYQEVQNNKKKNIKNSFTDKSLYSNARGLVLGGSETTRNSFLWLLVSMAENPVQQDLVYKELDTVLGKRGLVRWEDRNSLPYSFATIMESMRWKTLVPIGTLRMTTEDTTIQGYDVPRGTVIASNMWALHNDSRYWKSPEKFEPERFLLDGGKGVNFKPDSYVPFSFGKRNCPGEMIALTEIIQYFTAVVQKFKILPQEGDDYVKYETSYGLTYRPIGVKLRFLPRE